MLAPSKSSGPAIRVFFEPGENTDTARPPNRFMVHIAMQQNDESGSTVTDRRLSARNAPGWGD